MQHLATLPWVATYRGPTASTPAARQMRMLDVEPRDQVVPETFLTVPGLVAGRDRIALLQRGSSTCCHSTPGSARFPSFRGGAAGGGDMVAPGLRRPRAPLRARPRRPRRRPGRRARKPHVALASRQVQRVRTVAATAGRAVHRSVPLVANQGMSSYDCGAGRADGLTPQPDRLPDRTRCHKGRVAGVSCSISW